MVVHAMRAKSVEDTTRNRRFQREFRNGDPDVSRSLPIMS